MSDILVFLAGDGASDGDKPLRDKLIQQLERPLEQRGAVLWHRDRIDIGKEWRAEINEQIKKADIILLPVSPDFVSNGELFNREVTPAMERHEKGEALVVPIILRSVSWEGEPYSRLKALPTNKVAVASLQDQDKAFSDIAHEIEKKIIKICVERERQARQQKPPDEQGGSPITTRPTKRIPLLMRWRYRFIAGGIVLVIIGVYVLHAMAIGRYSTPAQKPALAPALSALPSDLSDGGTVFDKNRADGQLKREAAQKLQASDLVHAQALLQLGVEEDSSDAEALIYLENIQVRLSGQPYITLVASACLSGNDKNFIYKGRDTLQGIYVAQQEYNDQAKLAGHVRILLLIADSCAAQSQQQLAQDIANVAPQEHIVGVVGQPLDSEATQILGQEHIPFISSQTTCDVPVGAANFLSVAPSLQDEVQDAVKYISSLKANSVGIYYDPSNSYSNCLYNEFLGQYTANGLSVETYSTGLRYSFISPADDAQLLHYDLVYFTGGPTDAITLLNDLHAVHYQGPVLGSDLLYQYVDLPVDQRNQLNGMTFTAFGYHGLWNEERCNSVGQNQQLIFFCEYDAIFNPALFHQAPIFYGYTFADSDAVMGYDAVNLLLQASGTLLTAKKSSFGSVQFLHALNMFIQQHRQFMAVSGPITFGSDGYPTHAPVLVLSVEAGIHLEQTY